MNILRNTFAEIDLSALKQNLLLVKECLDNKTKLYFCIKADAYGHGAVIAAKAAEDINITNFVVELTEEGCLLRQNGIKGEIIAMGRANSVQMEYAVQYGISQCVADNEDIIIMQNKAKKIGKIGHVHLKIDTGMGRIGIGDKTQLFQVLRTLDKCKDVKLEGVFTHFASSEDVDKTYGHKQASIFFEYLKIINNEGYIPKIHLANSAGCIEMPEYGMDIARCGIAAYGYAPGESAKKKIPDLTPVMTIYSEIAQIKDVPANFKVGYNSTYTTSQETRIATVQIGYADGYPRELSNKGYMLIKGENGYSKAPVIGRVCMDQTMIDITGINGVKKGDLAVVMGRKDGVAMDANNIAELCGTICYEILTGFSSRISRIYT